MRSGLLRPHWSDQVITDNYLPPRGPKSPRVEVSAPGVEEVKDILCRWEPFHREASASDRLGNLYPHIPGAGSCSGSGSSRGLYDDPPCFYYEEDFL